MKKIIALSLSFFLATSALAGDTKWSFMGEFSNIARGNESGDCDGYALRLWKLSKTAREDQVIGIFTHADGPCDKLGTPIYGVFYSSINQTISFSAPNDSPAVLETERFSGKIESDKISGTLTIFNHYKRTTSKSSLLLKRR
ncbi:hypothetical protein GTP44_15405 [Duganella sp. FT50W]|uniref:Lipocalin-like domain-containing protein n=1 Tax=Duganella lactea TaxID=2692173 RepID=A0A6L8MJJ1_9BURK|nr:hypothetical protein [Duganella lactea]MYM83337.1 hypothetical protein [Duganella lactea]